LALVGNLEIQLDSMQVAGSMVVAICSFNVKEVALSSKRPEEVHQTGVPYV
jgi:small neutral amino acid transporter SnatA (MarC family)